MLSVIIPTRNRADLLQLALLSLQRQAFPDNQFEILVIDNGSTDNTQQVVKSFQRESANIRYFFDSTPGLHVGRHRGLKEAVGGVLVYTDDDIQATPTWLSAIAENFAEPTVALVGGNNYPDFKATPPHWLEVLWQRPAMGGQAIGSLSVLSLPEGRRDCSPFLVWGCNFSIRKRVLLEAGGFHPDAMPQELIRFRGDGETHVSQYVLDHGLRCVFDSRASVYHAVTPERMTLAYFRRRSYNQGVSDSYTRLRNADHVGFKPEQPFNPLALVKRMARGIRGSLLIFKPESSELRELFQAMRMGHQEGFAYHQAAYRDNPEVKAWVYKPDYF
jgi:glycosyltransferase involved in cell wall biosynthesis